MFTLPDIHHPKDKKPRSKFSSLSLFGILSNDVFHHLFAVFESDSNEIKLQKAVRWVLEFDEKKTVAAEAAGVTYDSFKWYSNLYSFIF